MDDLSVCATLEDEPSQKRKCRAVVNSPERKGMKERTRRGDESNE
jgi:hypothetical protein